MANYITEAYEAVDLIYDTLKNSNLTIGYIGKNDEKRLPQYPAVVVSSAPRDKSLHATHTFAVTLRVLLWVYHAKMSDSYSVRSQDDLKLVSDIETVLEEDKTLGQKVIFAYIESDSGGVMQPRSQKSDMVVGTRMSWVAATQKRWS